MRLTGFSLSAIGEPPDGRSRVAPVVVGYSAAVVVRLACDWFECDDGELDDAERRFAAELRRRAARWSLSPCATLIYPGESSQATIAYLDLSAPGLNLVLLTAGVHLRGTAFRADEVHNQDFSLPAVPGPLAIQAGGTPEELATRAADWFEDLIRRPVLHDVWTHAGHVYAQRYRFADGYPLSQTYNHSLAPAGQPETLVAAGHVRGRGWIQTAGLGKPDMTSQLPGYQIPSMPQA